MNVREKTASEKLTMTEYVTLVQAAKAFAIQTVFSTNDCLDMLYYAIQKGWISPSDVTTVRRGRWIRINKLCGEYECSVCHGADSNCSGYYGTHIVTEQDYCPNCGVRMDGGDD